MMHFGCITDACRGKQAGWDRTQLAPLASRYAGEVHQDAIAGGAAGNVHHGRPRTADYRERSCQLTPPNGAPGSFWWRSPVRRSTCSMPRR